MNGWTTSPLYDFTVIRFIERFTIFDVMRFGEGCVLTVTTFPCCSVAKESKSGPCQRHNELTYSPTLRFTYCVQKFHFLVQILD